MQIIFSVILGFFFVFFFLIIAFMFSPKLRSKLFRHQMNISKQILDDNANLMKELSTKSAQVGIDSASSILSKNKSNLSKMMADVQDIKVEADEMYYKKHGEQLKELKRKEAEIETEGIRKKAKAFKEGLQEGTIYCKHCGSLIDEDSTFCKVCGKEQ